MDYSHSIHGNILTLNFNGDLIGENHGPELISLVNDEINNGIIFCIIDLSKVRYINSSGIGVLITILTKFRNHGGEVMLVKPSKTVEKLLVITKLNSIFNIAETEELAIKGTEKHQFMKADVILGLQWGDEGKGKIVDYLAQKYDIVARFQGGPNAGHTLEFDEVKHVLHQVPSGIFRQNTKNVIGNGVVLDPIVFKKEIEDLKKFNLEAFYNLYVSKRAQLILPTHRLLDAAYEKSKGLEKIGSTLRGIGPTYEDKTARVGLRVGDITYPNFKARYEKLKARHCKVLEALEYSYDLEALEAEFYEAVEFLKKFKLIDSDYMINSSLNNEETVLAEGAQGSLLDIDFGSYPYVTSSNTTCAGVCTGLGLAPSRIGQVYGVFKAYCTRVGEGPFPTELNNDIGEALRRHGQEFGATTGRPRRCGWLDLPALKYAVMINGVTQLVMMKADVLSAFKEINICTGYKMGDGKVSTSIPYDLCNDKIEPVFQPFPGWKQQLTQVTRYNDLPQEFKMYIEFLEKYLSLPINIVSVGPNRKQTIFRDGNKIN